MNTPQNSSPIHDVAVIGAGVVGCAIARRFALDGASVVVVEKALDILDGASKGNSAILHTGFDAPPGSLEAACIRAGYGEFMAVRERYGLPLLACGALVIAWSEEEAARLDAQRDAALQNGVEDVALLSERETRALEPGLGPGVVASLRVPGEAIVDPWTSPHAYLAHALALGARLRRGCEVTSGSFDGAAWTLETGAAPVRARAVVNAAGLYGDVVVERLTGRRPFAIKPRKGQFVVFDKSAYALASHILLPVPNERTKGVVVCRTAWGNLLVGPTAEEQESRDTAALDPATLEALRARGERILPALAQHEVTAVYAGLRPATQEKDYRIAFDAEHRLATVGGIRSTGLSAALGIAQHVARETAGWIDGRTPPDAPWPRARNIAESGPRDWSEAGNGGIVCHCERVTRREIEAALEGPLAAQTVAGLKRKTRALMGRCQGFYCSAEIAALTKGRLTEPLAEPFAVSRDG